MSEYHISLVDSHISTTEAERAAQDILRYLVDNDIVEATPSDCVLGNKPGYRPGTNFIAAADISPADESASNCNYDDFIRWVTNGLAIRTNNCEAYNPEGTWDRVTCPQCRQHRPQDEVWQSAVSAWYEGQDESLLTCAHCGNASSITAWDHHGDFALGHLVLTFWNWPPLSSEFVARISAITGNPLQIITGKL